MGLINDKVSKVRSICPHKKMDKSYIMYGPDENDFADYEVKYFCLICGAEMLRQREDSEFEKRLVNDENQI